MEGRLGQGHSAVGERAVVRVQLDGPHEAGGLVGEQPESGSRPSRPRSLRDDPATFVLDDARVLSVLLRA